MNHDLDTRVRDALNAAANTVTTSTPPDADSLVVTPHRHRWQWPLVAVAAATAVSLAVALPYGLLRDRDQPQQPAAGQQTGIPDDPPPLERVSGPLPKVSHIMGIYEPTANGYGRAVVVDASGTGRDVPGGKNYYQFATTIDLNTYYVSWNDNDADCTGRVFKVTVDDKGKVKSRAEVEGAARKGVVYSNLTVSPNGKRLALIAEAAGFNGRDCDLSRSKGSGLSTLDLATNERRDWTSDHDNRSLPIAFNSVAWSQDNKYVVFLWPGDDRGTDVRPDRPTPSPTPTPTPTPRPGKILMLDPALPSGDLVSRSREIPTDPIAADYDYIMPVQTMDEHAILVGAYAPQGGARVLAFGHKAHEQKLHVFDLRLGSGDLTEIDSNYTP